MVAATDSTLLEQADAPDGLIPQTTLDAALALHSKGLHPIPLCTHDHRGMTPRHVAGCDKPGKAPVIRWGGAGHRPLTRSEIRNHFRGPPQKNLGAVMGRGCGYVSLDVDTEEGENRLHSLAGGVRPHTWQCWSGGESVRPGGGRFRRYRLIYKLPDGSPAPTVPLTGDGGEEHLRIQGDGAQCVLPPSVHQSGTQLEWVDGQSPYEMDAAPAPEWLLRILNNPPGGCQGGGTAPPPSRPTEAGQTIPAGARDDRLMRMGAAVRRQGGTEGEILALLRAVNERCEDRPGNPRPSDADLRRIARSCCRWAPLEVPPERELARAALGADGAPAALELDVCRASDVEAREAEFLDAGKRIAVGAITFDQGDPGLGKSLHLVHVAAAVSAGRPIPPCPEDRPACEPAHVILIAPEDVAEFTIRPRLEAAEADLDRVHIVRGVRLGEDGLPLLLPGHFDLVRELARRHRARLLGIDPFLAVVDPGKDAVSEQAMRSVLDQVKRLAEEERLAALLTRHLNKSEGGPALYRGSGSIAIAAIARAVYHFGAHPDDPGLRVLACAKYNMGPMPGALTFRVNEATVPVLGLDGRQVLRPFGRLDWEGYSDLTADELANAGAQARREREQERRGQRRQARRQQALQGTDQAVLRDIQAQEGGTIQADIARRTGLDPRTVRSSLLRLQEAGRIEPAEVLVSTGSTQHGRERQRPQTGWRAIRA
jgi:hypothetical protein